MEIGDNFEDALAVEQNDVMQFGGIMVFIILGAIISFSIIIIGRINMEKETKKLNKDFKEKYIDNISKMEFILAYSVPFISLLIFTIYPVSILIIIIAIPITIVASLYALSRRNSKLVELNFPKDFVNKNLIFLALMSSPSILSLISFTLFLLTIK